MEFSRATISKWLDPIRKNVPSPVIAATGLGLAGAGLGVGLWDNIIETGGSLGRYPIRKMTGMSNEEYNKAMEDLAEDDRYRWMIPMALGTILGGGYLALRRNPNQVDKGLHSWIPKTASINNDELFTYGGYVPAIDYGQVINARNAKYMFTNDPHLEDEPYVRNMGLSIINDAVNRAGYVNPTLGNIYDSASDKMKKKLSWAGLTDIAANTMIANATAHLITSAIGAVAPLPDDTKHKLIDTATWATAITSILK